MKYRYNQSIKKYRPGFWAVTSVIIIAALIWLQNEEELYDPVAIFLTWQQDPTTTMTIDWHTTPEDGERESAIQYKKEGDESWILAEGDSHPFPHSDRTIHRVEITGLDPGTNYQIRFGEDSKEYYFQTMPADLSEPIRFVKGGDTGYERDGRYEEIEDEDFDDGFIKFITMNQVVMEYEPDFILWGGDLSYADEDPSFNKLWYGWFTSIKESLVYDDGRIVPIVIAIGDHEIFYERRLDRLWHPIHRPDGPELSKEEIEIYMEEYGLEEGKPTFFFDLFAFPGYPAYNVLDFGDYMSIFALDTDAFVDIEGEQTTWLQNKLAERQDRAHIFPIYHEPAYPSHRSFTRSTSTRIRENWVPLFEQYGVRVAFENHDHTYKRTWPIKENEPSEDGVIFIGDGSWVQGPREGDNQDDWYINEFASINHGIIVTIHGDTQDYIMVSRDGDEFDSFNTSEPLEMPPPPPPEPPAYEPHLVYPLSAPRTELQPEFKWEAVSDAIEYEMQVSTGNFASGLIFETTTDNTSVLYPDKLEVDETYRWRVRALNDGGEGPFANSPFTTVREEATSADEVAALPTEFELFHNYPNPFNPETTIRYGLPVSAQVDLRVYDVIGREVSILVNEEQSAGFHDVVFRSEALNTGVYILRFTANPTGDSGTGNYTQTRSMTLVK